MKNTQLVIFNKDIKILDYWNKLPNNLKSSIYSYRIKRGHKRLNGKFISSLSPEQYADIIKDLIINRKKVVIFWKISKDSPVFQKTIKLIPKRIIHEVIQGEKMDSGKESPIVKIHSHVKVKEDGKATGMKNLFNYNKNHFLSEEHQNMLFKKMIKVEKRVLHPRVNTKKVKVEACDTFSPKCLNYKRDLHSALNNLDLDESMMGDVKFNSLWCIPGIHPIHSQQINSKGEGLGQVERKPVSGIREIVFNNLKIISHLLLEEITETAIPYNKISSTGNNQHFPEYSFVYDMIEKLRGLLGPEEWNQHKMVTTLRIQDKEKGNIKQAFVNDIKDDINDNLSYHILKWQELGLVPNLDHSLYQDFCPGKIRWAFNPEPDQNFKMKVQLQPRFDCGLKKYHMTCKPTTAEMIKEKVELMISKLMERYDYSFEKAAKCIRIIDFGNYDLGPQTEIGDYITRVVESIIPGIDRFTMYKDSTLSFITNEHTVIEVPLVIFNPSGGVQVVFRGAALALSITTAAEGLYTRSEIDEYFKHLRSTLAINKGDNQLFSMIDKDYELFVEIAESMNLTVKEEDTFLGHKIKIDSENQQIVVIPNSTSFVIKKEVQERNVDRIGTFPGTGWEDRKKHHASGHAFSKIDKVWNDVYHSHYGYTLDEVYAEYKKFEPPMPEGISLMMREIIRDLSKIYKFGKNVEDIPKEIRDKFFWLLPGKIAAEISKTGNFDKLHEYVKHSLETV